MKFTHKELLQVPCIRCMAAVGQPCVAPGNRRTPIKIAIRDGIPILGFHKEREELRVKVPMLEVEGLDGSDKALVMGYGFMILADACAANSEKLFGKLLTSREIQQFFAAKAIDELKADGLIGLPKVKHISPVDTEENSQ